MPLRPCSPTFRRHGVTLLELVIVTVIIGVIAAIAVPRLSRGAEGADRAALSRDLQVINKAIDLYATEHGGSYPDAANADVQLTQYSDAAGNTSPTKTPPYIYGPYLHKPPPAPGGKYPGSIGMAAADAPGIGWIYNPIHGRVYLNRGTAIDDTKEDTALSNLRALLGL